jgi:hypothetical protein
MHTAVTRLYFLLTLEKGSGASDWVEMQEIAPALTRRAQAPPNASALSRVPYYRPAAEYRKVRIRVWRNRRARLRPDHLTPIAASDSRANCAILARHVGSSISAVAACAAR